MLCRPPLLTCSVTINPPLYGADTPLSLFDEKLPYGWNLRNLGCLLKRPDVPQVRCTCRPAACAARACHRGCCRCAAHTCTASPPSAMWRAVR
jgi:hypothetical protein